MQEKSWTFEKHIDLQSQVIYVDKVFFYKNLHILQDCASSVHVGILNTQLLKICSKYDKTTSNWCHSAMFCNSVLMCIMKLWIMKGKNPTSKYLRSWNLSQN